MQDQSSDHGITKIPDVPYHLLHNLSIPKFQFNIHSMLSKSNDSFKIGYKYYYTYMSSPLILTGAFVTTTHCHRSNERDKRYGVVHE